MSSEKIKELEDTIKQLEARIVELSRQGREMYTDEQLENAADRYIQMNKRPNADRESFVAGFGFGVPAGEKWAYRQGFEAGKNSK